MKKIIFDCHYVTYRGAYGMNELSYNEQQTHVVFDFVRQILKMAEKFETNQFIFCFDSKNLYREIVYPNYKHKRKTVEKTPEELVTMKEIYRQRDILRLDMLPYMGFRNIFRQNGYESDDLMAEIVAKNPDDEFIVVAKDKDLYQFLEGDRVKLFDFKKFYTQDDFEKEYLGLKPEQWKYVKAIAGCKSDEVEGIERIGDKYATKYLLGMLKPGKILDKITCENGLKIAERNLPLVELPYKNGRKSIKVDLVSDEIDIDMFGSIFGQYGFRYFLRDDVWCKWVDLFSEKEC